MSAPATNPLETLLAEALSARADQLDHGDLAPATPPAVVVPLHRRRPVLAAAVAAGLVAAATVVAVAVSADDRTSRSDEPPVATRTASPTPSVTPEADPTRGPLRTDDRFSQDDPGYVAPGTEVSYDDGSTAMVSADSRTLTVTDADGRDHTASLDSAQDGSPNRLSGVQLQLGQAGPGYLVRYGEEYADLTVLVYRGDELVPAEVADDVPFGDGEVELDKGLAYEGARYLTWIKDGSLFTRVMIGEAPEGRYDVYGWEVTGPGEGGGTPASGTRDLVPTKVGTFCFDFVATPSTYQTC